jgi:hypothetical protein
MMLRSFSFTTPRALLAGAALLLTATTAPAALVFFNTEAAFDLAAPGLAEQTFGMALGNFGSVNGFGNPLNSSTDNLYFKPGNILPGLSLAATGGTAGAELAVAAVGFLGFTEVGVLANAFSQTLNLNFAPGVGAVGLGLVSSGTTDFTVSFFSASEVLLGSTVVSGVPSTGSGLFFGVAGNAGETIGRINLSSSGNTAEGVNLVKFGTPIPEPTTALFGAALLGVCSLARGRATAGGESRPQA